MTLLYSFHPIAVEQQVDIWLYTNQHWGPRQADQYINGLHERLSQLAQDSSLLKRLPEGIDEKVRFFHYGRHYVFVRQAPADLLEKIQVLTILHDSMDIPVRLREIFEWL